MGTTSSTEETGLRGYLGGLPGLVSFQPVTQRYTTLQELYTQKVRLVFCPRVGYGILTARADGEAIDAERHLTLGTSDSPAVFANMEYDWYKSDEPSTAPLYAARAVFPYLLVGNLRAANKALLLFTSKLSSSNPGLGVQSVSSSSSDLRVYPSLPLLNFLGLLLLSIERGGADLFRQLKSHYASHIKDAGTWDEALAHIGEMYFGIKIPSQSNPLFDMMGSLFGGGGGPAAPPKSTNRRVEAPAPAPGLD